MRTGPILNNTATNQESHGEVGRLSRFLLLTAELRALDRFWGGEMDVFSCAPTAESTRLQWMVPEALSILVYLSELQNKTNTSKREKI